MKRIHSFVQGECAAFTSSVRSFLPSHVVVPFIQNGNENFVFTANTGDFVKEGQVIVSDRNEYSTYESEIHAPLPGKIESIVNCTLPNGKVSPAAKIKFSGKFDYLGRKNSERDWNVFSSTYLLEELKNKGVTNTFDGCVSLAGQIKKCALKENRFLIVRLFDSEPGLTIDSFIAENFRREVAVGADIIAKAMNAEGIIFAVSKKEPAAMETVLPSYNVPVKSFEFDNTKYPCGFVPDIIKEVKKSSKNESSRFAHISRNCIFIDAQTSYSAYEAAGKGIPVLEKFIEISGTSLSSSAMFKVRLGTSIKDLVMQCGGFKSRLSKVIVNGLVNGFQINTLDMPVTKEVKAITFLSFSELHNQQINSCIRCGKCRSICPENLYPDLIYRAATDSEIIQTTVLCSQCNLCNSICPSRLPLSQKISILRKQYEV
ncbi:MAG: hypothetical protein SO116_06500 [Treponema sp.]|nr:hypothetical protein [Treponema sp.]